VDELAVPPAVVTEICTVPRTSFVGVVVLSGVAALWGSVTAVMLVGLVTVKLAAVVVPNLTAVAPKRSVPVMVTDVPPLALPVGGVNDVMAGADATKVNPPGAVAVPPPVVRLTLTGPATWASVTADTWVGLVTVKLAAAVAPKSTAVAPMKPLPLMVTALPPLVEPEWGLTVVMVGVGATKVY
jgi:hypothetical protein